MSCNCKCSVYHSRGAVGLQFVIVEIPGHTLLGFMLTSLKFRTLVHVQCKIKHTCAKNNGK